MLVSLVVDTKKEFEVQMFLESTPVEERKGTDGRGWRGRCKAFCGI